MFAVYEPAAVTGWKWWYQAAEAIEQLLADHGLHVVQQMQSMRPKPM